MQGLNFDTRCPYPPVSCLNIADILSRLTTLEPQIEELMEMKGVARLSLGIVQPIFQANYGWEIPKNVKAPSIAIINGQPPVQDVIMNHRV